jgi:hypothetical protein
MHPENGSSAGAAGSTAVTFRPPGFSVRHQISPWLNSTSSAATKLSSVDSFIRTVQPSIVCSSHTTDAGVRTLTPGSN